jgi:hypothetical protein
MLFGADYPEEKHIYVTLENGRILTLPFQSSLEKVVRQVSAMCRVPVTCVELLVNDLHISDGESFLGEFNRCREDG